MQDSRRRIQVLWYRRTRHSGSARQFLFSRRTCMHLLLRLVIRDIVPVSRPGSFLERQEAGMYPVRDNKLFAELYPNA